VGQYLVRSRAYKKKARRSGSWPSLSSRNDIIGRQVRQTESGAVWLDAALTSPFKFFQFWVNVDDRDVVRYLKYFTWLAITDINDLAEVTALRPEGREAQTVLARELTRLVHGQEGLLAATRASDVLFGRGDFRLLSAQELLDVFSDVPSTSLNRSLFEGNGVQLAELLKVCGFATSNSDARRLIAGGGVYLNGVRLSSQQSSVTTSDLIDGCVFVVRKGKRDHHVIHVTTA
jgi:tyrosyl-tRNA synthetase